MPEKIQKKIPNMPDPDNAALFGRIVDILEKARSHVARTVMPEQRDGGRILADRT